MRIFICVFFLKKIFSKKFLLSIGRCGKMYGSPIAAGVTILRIVTCEGFMKEKFFEKVLAIRYDPWYHVSRNKQGQRAASRGSG